MDSKNRSNLHCPCVADSLQVVHFDFQIENVQIQRADFEGHSTLTDAKLS